MPSWQALYPAVSKLEPVVGSAEAKTPSEGPIIVSFFASWCPPCTDEFRHLNELKSNGELGNAKIIGINVFENFGGNPDPERLAAFLEKTKPQFPLVVGNQNIRDGFGGVDRIPTVVVYSASGIEAWRFIHHKDAKKTHATRKDLIEALKLAE